MKFSKRIISLILSLLMVVTSIPFFAVTVSADTGTEKKISSLVYYNEGTADKSSQPVYSKAYDGTQTDASKGYTISAKFNIGNTLNGDSIVFSIGNSSDSGNTSHYLSFREDGSFHLNYDGHYYNSWNVNTFGYSPSTNTEYQLTISIAPYADTATGNTYEVLKFYLDGNLVNVYDNKATFTNYNANYTTCRYLSGNWDASFGKGCSYWNNSNDGSVVDFAVFNDVLTPDEISAYLDIYKRDYSSIGNTLDALKTVMAEYEEVMRNSEVSKTNMLNAYNAYIEASEIYDSVYYGKSSLDSSLIQNVACNLAVAVDLMTEIPATVTGSDVPVAADTWFSSSNDAKYLLSTNNRENNKVFNNILYAGDWNKNGMSADTKGSVIQKLFAADNPVILYNGSDDKPVIPIMISSRNNAGYNKTRRFWYCAPVQNAGQHANNNMSTEWSLIKSGWYGGSTNGDWAWMFDVGWDGVGTAWSDIERFPVAYNDNVSSTVTLTRGTDNSFVNAVQFDGTPTQVSTTYSINFALGCGGDNLDDTTYPVYSNIRVINYKALTDAITSKIFNYNVANYTNGGLTELFTAVDNALAIDPQSYFLDGTDSRYNECVSAIENAISTVNSITPTADGIGYQAVRDILDTEIDENSGLVYTTYSFDKYRKIIDICRAYMASVYSGGSYDAKQLSSGYVYNADMVSLADAASNVLNKTIDVSELRNLYETAKNLDIFENEVQTKTFESWQELQSELDSIYNTATGFTNIQGELDAEENKTVTLSTGINFDYDRTITDSESSAKSYIYEKTQFLRTASTMLKDIPKDQVEAFDAAYEVGSTVPVTVYDAQTREEQMQAMETAKAKVYMSAEEATNAGYTFPEGVEKQELVYLSDAGSVDAQTTAVLTAITTLDENKAEFTVSVNGFSDGKTYTYGAPYILAGQSTNGEWKIKYGDNKTINICVDANTPVDLIVEDNIDATFTSKAGEETENSIPVYIYDGYGKLVEIRYENDEVTETYPTTNNLTAATVPFYDFTVWKFETETTDDGKMIYKFTPQYKAQDDGAVLIQQEGKEVKRAAFDTAVTLTSDGTNYGWVNKIETETGTVKYQIVSYSTGKFKSYAISPCNYYPFYKDNNETYYVMDGESKVTLTDQNVDGSILPEGQNVGATANDHLNFKLDNKYPFVYTEKAVVVENATSDSKGRYRVYARFTDGAVNYESFGVRVIVGDGKLDGKFTCSGKTTSNQYAFTLNLTQNQVTGVDNITFKPYVNHYFEYSGKQVDAFYTSEIVLNINAEQGGV